MGHCVAVLFFLLVTVTGTAQSCTDSITVHFLYGSKPKAQFKDIERKWFGGKLGGHVGIESAPDSILNFVPAGKFHWFANRHNLHGRFVVHNNRSFPRIFGGNAEDMKTLSVVIPIDARQRRVLDSLRAAYLAEAPFDYAFVGMRCGSSTYYILSQLGIVKRYSLRKTYLKIFYPRRLRKRILRMADDKQWSINRQEGTTRRVWERD
jgi:hypothetical protein